MRRPRGLVLGIVVLVGIAWLIRLVDAGTTAVTGDDDAPSPSGETITASADALQEAVVVRHTDGDTLTVRPVEDGPAGSPGRDVTVRLLEIDTPETGMGRPPRECFHEEATAELRRLAPSGAAVWLERDEELTDPYGRRLMYLYVQGADGSEGELEQVNHAMVLGGFARSVLFPPNDRHIDRIRAAEASARDAGRGLWGACG